MFPLPPRFLSWPPVPPPVERPKSTCPVCQEPAPANEMKAYGRCESCHTDPRLGHLDSLARPKQRAPRK